MACAGLPTGRPASYRSGGRLGRVIHFDLGVRKTSVCFKITNVQRFYGKKHPSSCPEHLQAGITDAPASPEVLSCVSVHHPLPQEAQHVAHSRPSPGTSHTSPGPSDASKQDTHPHTLPKAKQQLAPGPRLLGSPGQPSKHHGFTLLADRARGSVSLIFPQTAACFMCSSLSSFAQCSLEILPHQSLKTCLALFSGCIILQ